MWYAFGIKNSFLFHDIFLTLYTCLIGFAHISLIFHSYLACTYKNMLVYNLSCCCYWVFNTQTTHFECATHPGFMRISGWVALSKSAEGLWFSGQILKKLTQLGCSFNFCSDIEGCRFKTNGMGHRYNKTSQKWVTPITPNTLGAAGQN